MDVRPQQSAGVCVPEALERRTDKAEVLTRSRERLRQAGGQIRLPFGTALVHWRV